MLLLLLLLFQMCADGGVLSDAALQQLEEAAYTGAARLEGGYAGWSEVREQLTGPTTPTTEKHIVAVTQPPGI